MNHLGLTLSPPTPTLTNSSYSTAGRHSFQRQKPTEPFPNTSRNFYTSSCNGVVRKSDKEILQEVAEETLHIIHTGSYIGADGTRYEFGAMEEWCQYNTRYFPKWADVLSGWLYSPACSTPPASPTMIPPPTLFHFSPYSSVRTARKMAAKSPPTKHHSIGMLNSACPLQPGGEFQKGIDGQEESLVRCSALYSSLTSEIGMQYYASHRGGENDTRGFYDHSMLYSPSVVIFRADEKSAGFALTEPLKVNVVSCTPVDAHFVRKRWKGYHDELEEKIESVMRERMARILRCFEYRGDRRIVLNAFGVPAPYENKVKVIAKLWADLLLGVQSRFGRSFEEVQFALGERELQGSAFEEFKYTFEKRLMM